MKKIAVIGAGFSGTMLSVQLTKQADCPLEIFLINEVDTFNKGFAYNTYSDLHLLNVITSRMSAFPEMPDHFLDWVMTKSEFCDKDKALIANSFLPRKLYGDYLGDIYKKFSLTAANKNIKLLCFSDKVNNLDLLENEKVRLSLNNNQYLETDYCVIATGNQIPRNPTIKNTEFYKSVNYFQNPWSESAVSNLSNDLPVLIIGNGLTMVDTVLGLLENGFNGKIFSISPNGFNILPHQFNSFSYKKLTEELYDGMSLYDLLKFVNKHIKILRTFGVSAEPAIDSLRPYTQIIWKSFSEMEKKQFMGRLRHLWGVARHRIPLKTYETIQQLKSDGILSVNSGKVIDINEFNNQVSVEYFDKRENCKKNIFVSRVINCSGPETDFELLENNFLKNTIEKNILIQDNLKLGIKTDTSNYKIYNPNGGVHNNLFTMGSNLKGELWESTAVNELRLQAENLAGVLLKM